MLHNIPHTARLISTRLFIIVQLLLLTTYLHTIPFPMKCLCCGCLVFLRFSSIKSSFCISSPPKFYPGTLHRFELTNQTQILRFRQHYTSTHAVTVSKYSSKTFTLHRTFRQSILPTLTDPTGFKTGLLSLAKTDDTFPVRDSPVSSVTPCMTRFLLVHYSLIASRTTAFKLPSFSACEGVEETAALYDLIPL